VRCIDAGSLALGESILQRETLCSVLEMSGDLDAASAHAEATLALYPASTSIVMHAAYCRAARGDRAGAQTLRGQLFNAAGSPQHYVHMYIDSGSGDTDSFFNHAMAVADAHEPQVLLLPAHPIFRRHHSDPRWPLLLDKIRFPQDRRN
jgi:hypothetical protein